MIPTRPLLAIIQAQLISLPALLAFFGTALLILALSLLALLVMIRFGLRLVPQKHVVRMFEQLATSGKAGIMLTAGLFLTILFGVPSFLAAMYTGSSQLEKTYGMEILKWLLGGWGLGGGVSLISLTVTKKDPAATADQSGR